MVGDASCAHSPRNYFVQSATISAAAGIGKTASGARTKTEPDAKAPLPGAACETIADEAVEQAATGSGTATVSAHWSGPAAEFFPRAHEQVQ